MSDATSTRTVDRALDLLSFVCERGGIETGRTLSECAREAGLSPSTASRLLKTLEDRGFVARDEESRYHPGTRVMQIGASALSRDNLTRVCRPYMRELVDEVHESVYLVIRNYDGNGLYLASEACSQPIQHISWVGKTVPFEGSAAGAALAGNVEPRSYASETGIIEPDVTAISSPVMSGDVVVAALSVVAPAYRIVPADIKRIGRAIAAKATALTDIFSLPEEGERND